MNDYLLTQAVVTLVIIVMNYKKVVEITGEFGVAQACWMRASLISPWVYGAACLLIKLLA